MMKPSHAVVLFFLSALSLAAQATCGQCGSNSEYCSCRDAESLYRSMSSYQGNTEENPIPSDVESDSSIELIPDASITGTGDQVDGYVVVQPHYHQGGPVSSNPPSAPPYSLLRMDELRSALANIGNLGFHPPQRPPGSDSGRNTNQPAPTVSQTVLTEDQYSSYSNSTADMWDLLHDDFNSLKAQVDQLTRMNNETEKLYKEATSEEELIKINREHANPQRPDPEIIANSLIEQFQVNLQTALSTVQASNFRSLVSLVSPVDTSHSLEWARGNFKFIYDSLFKFLKTNSSNPQMAVYFQNAMQVIEQVSQFYRNPEPKENIPFFSIDNSSMDITQAQTIMTQLVNYFNAELRQGVRSFALSYSGIPSPFNHGSIYFFIIEDAAIIISPHFGILISHDVDEAFQYIMNYTLLLAVNGISDKIHIRKVKANRPE